MSDRQSVGPTESAIRRAVGSVTDPELDESIVELGYVDHIEVDGGSVTLSFTLPTAWCSPAFAWMMATDARDAIEALSGVERARIVLRDHVHEREITTGINDRASFAETFPDADGGVESVRETLEHKARLARQYDAVEALLDAGVTPEQVCSLRETDLDRSLADGRVGVRPNTDGIGICVDADPIERYLEKATATGCLDDGPLFRSPEGEPIEPDRFDVLHNRTRLAAVNMSGQGGVCAALNESRRRELDRDPPIGPTNGPTGGDGAGRTDSPDTTSDA
ncbi:MAG: metal-sulfur cluster assembly factor [Halobacteriota archaeon]